MRSRKLLPLTLGIALIIGSTATAITGAAFTDSEQVTSSVSAGTLNLQINDKDSAVPQTIAISPTGVLKPGDVRTATFKVTNQGNLAAPVTITRAVTGNATLAGVVDVSIARTGSNAGTVLATGKLNGATVPTGVASMAPGAVDTYTVTFALPASAPNSVMGLTSGLTLTFNAQL